MGSNKILSIFGLTQSSLKFINSCIMMKFTNNHNVPFNLCPSSCSRWINVRLNWLFLKSILHCPGNHPCSHQINKQSRPITYTCVMDYDGGVGGSNFIIMLKEWNLIIMDWLHLWAIVWYIFIVINLKSLSHYKWNNHWYHYYYIQGI